MNIKQCSKFFRRDNYIKTEVDEQLDNFLKEHPNYVVSNISFAKYDNFSENLFVVFNVEEETDRINKTEATHRSDKFMDTVEYLKQGKLPPLNTDNDEGLHTHKYGWT